VALAADYPLLSDYCRYHGAQAALRGGKPDRAAELAAQVETASVLTPEARLLRAEALRDLGRPAEGAAIWAEYLRQSPGGKQVGKAHLRIAEAAGLQAVKGGPGAAEARVRALDHYKLALIKAPLAKQAPEARKQLAALAALVPGGAQRAELDGWQRFEQAVVVFRANRNTESEAAFTAILGGKAPSPLLRCKATFYLAKSIFKQRQRARSVPHYEAATKACGIAGERELVAKSLFDAAKGLMNAKKHLEAIRHLEAIEKEFPDHTLADDARLWEAEAYEDLKKPAEVVRLLSSLPQLYPQGDMAHEALWRLARGAYLEKRATAALEYLEKAIALGRPRYYYSLGQALYWKARILEQGGRPEAVATYQRCAREYPLSFYALLAFNRLRERHAAAYRALQHELLGKTGVGKGRWHFAPRELFGRTAFLRGVELARLGFGSAAGRELAQAGLSTSKAASDDDLWLAAVLYDRAGLWNLSHQVPRTADTAYKRSYPSGEAYRRWALAYPLAFEPMVRAGAKAAQLPPELVLSIMREESGFSPGIESYANAVGLMQLILPTARAAGSAHKLKVTREALRDPATNIKLGSTFLGFLHRTFQKVVPLAVAGYNAGEGAVYKWLRQYGAGHPQLQLDELIERIPYDQTRRYTKRVVSTFFTYSVLYRQGDARIPVLGQKLPVLTSAKAFGR